MADDGADQSAALPAGWKCANCEAETASTRRGPRDQLRVLLEVEVQGAGVAGHRGAETSCGRGIYTPGGPAISMWREIGHFSKQHALSTQGHSGRHGRSESCPWSILDSRGMGR